MRYSRYLMEGERVMLDSRRHASVLLRPLLLAIVVVVGALAIGMTLTPRDGRDLVDSVVGVIACFFILRFLWRVWEWRVQRTVITNHRIFQIAGVLTRKVSSMPLARMTDLTYRRPILGRLFGYGEILVESAGAEQGLARLDHLPKPDEFYRTITRSVAAITPRSADDEVQVPNWDEEDTGPLPRVIV